MDRTPLRSPEEWAEKLRTLPFVLSLSYGDQLLDSLPDGWDLDDVAADLSQGTWVARHPGRQNQFRIFGTEVVLRVRCRPGINNKHPITQVLNVDEIRTPSRTERLLVQRVEFHRVHEEVLCDLDALEALQTERLKLTEVASLPELERHGELNDIAHRDYSALGDLIALLEQRPTTPERVASGKIVEGGAQGQPPVVIVECPTAGPVESPGRRVSLILPDGQQFNTKIVQVHQRLLHIAEPKGWPGVTTGPVKIASIPPFTMLRNRFALNEFLSQKVVGAWHDLARLLCRPSELTVPSAAPLTEFYYDTDSGAHRLDHEQRAAVSGAVTSPHAFLIQGPPGTGKTEVISETIQQLVARGERVLMLAPAHVAVDEVLKRVGSKPGIRPLRITFDDDRVDEDVRVHLPHKIGIALLDGVLLPKEQGRAERWSKEAEHVRPRLAALESAASAEEQLGVLRRSAQSTDRRAAVSAEQLAAYRVQADREVTRAERELAAAQRRHDEALAIDVRLTEAATALHATWKPVVIATAAAERLSSITRDELDSLDRAENAAQERRQIWQDQGNELAQLESRIGEARAELKTVRLRVVDATVVLQANESDVSRMEAARIEDGSGPDAVAEARRTVEHSRREAQRLQEARRQREKDLMRAIRDRNEVEHRLDALANTAEQSRQRAESAGGRRKLALHHLLDLLAGYDAPANLGAGRTPVDDVGDTAVDCDRLATAVLRITRAGPGKLTPMEKSEFGGVLVGLVRRVDELRRAEAASLDARRALDDAETRLATRTTEWKSSTDTTSARLRLLEEENHDHLEALRQQRAEVNRLEEELALASAKLRELDVAFDIGELEWMRRRSEVLGHLPKLAGQWCKLIKGRTDEQLAEEIRTSVVRATNLVCATTKGIAGRGSDVVRDMDFDTLIVDEASRVTDSEFLIGAVRARRWVLVGDENQLPPHVDQEDERFVHALIALHRYEKRQASSLSEAVDQLAEHWLEDVELRQFRSEEVLRLATTLEGSGVWRGNLQSRVNELHKRLSVSTGPDGGGRRREDDAGRALLRTMDGYLVRSLFDRVIRNSADGLRQRLKLQRRMPEPLARIVAKPVYDGDFLSPTGSELAEGGARPLVVPSTFEQPAVFIDTSLYGKRAEDQPAKHGNGFENAVERQMILDACQAYHDELNRTGSQPITVSVLSFYRAQAKALGDELGHMSLPLFDIQVVDVVDRIQGQQSDLVLVSFVRAKARGSIGPRFGSWLQDVRRLNVACTRARRALVLVGHAETLRRLGTTGRDRAPRDSSAEPAVRFYGNLFDLFENSSDFVMLKKFDKRPSR